MTARKVERRPVVAVPSFTGNAVQALAQAGPGVRLFGLNAGQYDVLDLLRGTVEITGPADVVVTTWTIGVADGQAAAWLLESGALRSLRFLVDMRFPKKEPRYCSRLLRRFGPDTFTVIRTHAKFVLVRNERWNVAITTSANFNSNSRLEHWSWEDGGAVPDMLWEFVEQLDQVCPPGLHDMPPGMVRAIWKRMKAHGWKGPTLSESGFGDDLLGGSASDGGDLFGADSDLVRAMLDDDGGGM